MTYIYDMTKDMLIGNLKILTRQIRQAMWKLAKLRKNFIQNLGKIIETFKKPKKKNWKKF